MDKNFLEYFKEFSFLKFEDLKLLYSVVRIKSVRPGEKIVDIGEMNYNVIVVLRGLLRNYIITPKGEERTQLLSRERMATSSYASFLHNQPSTECIEAIESSLLLLIDMKKFEERSKNNPRLLELQIKGLRLSLSEAIERIYSYTSLSPEERFIRFREQHPELIQRVPQKYLASFLGITTVSLSRIKARVARSRTD